MDSQRHAKFNEPLVDYWNGTQWGKAMFVGIRDCNVFIENIEKVPDLSAYDKETWKAEAKVLKAFYHFWMMRMYGPIPIIKENIPVSAGEDEVRVVRDKIDDIVTYIVSLIDESVEYLPLNIQNEAAEMGRITRPAAKAIKAKILAFAASPFLMAIWIMQISKMPKVNHSLIRYMIMRNGQKLRMPVWRPFNVRRKRDMDFMSS